MSDRRSITVLIITTWAFTVCFAVWMMFGVIGIPLRQQLQLDSTQFGLLTATPILTGSLFRLPLGIWTDRIGGRILMALLLVLCAIPLWFAADATALWQFLLLGLALGLVGASFSVGTPYVARFFPPERRGFAMGVFGAGTVGAALNMFIAPSLMNAYGWQAVPRAYAAVLLLTAIAFWFLSAPDPGVGKVGASLREQLAVMRDRRVWKYCQYYSIVFGGFTALSIWMPQYFVSEYGFSVAQARCRTASGPTTSRGGSCGPPGSPYSSCPIRTRNSQSAPSMGRTTSPSRCHPGCSACSSSWWASRSPSAWPRRSSTSASIFRRASAPSAGWSAWWAVSAASCFRSCSAYYWIGFASTRAASCYCTASSPFR
jgi:MFS family permease